MSNKEKKNHYLRRLEKILNWEKRVQALTEKANKTKREEDILRAEKEIEKGVRF